MPPVELLLPFSLAMIVFAFTPGPGMFYMAIQTMAHGHKAGWLSSAAFHLASYVHIFFAAFGVTLLLHSLPYLYVVLKMAGALYLVWMGVQMIRNSQMQAADAVRQTRKPARQAFRNGLLVEILNPKSALFYFAFLPQFTSAEASAPVWIQIIVLGTLANCTFSLTDALCIFASRMVAGRASVSRRGARIGRRIGGGILVAMGAKVAFGNS